jgi:hypothetical protein
VQFYHYFVSQSSEFCCHNPLCCFSISVYCCKHVCHYWLNTETNHAHIKTQMEIYQITYPCSPAILLKRWTTTIIFPNTSWNTDISVRYHFKCYLNCSISILYCESCKYHVLWHEVEEQRLNEAPHRKFLTKYNEYKREKSYITFMNNITEAITLE